MDDSTPQTGVTAGEAIDRGADDARDLAALRRLQREPAAFERLYREFYPRLFDFVLRILGSPSDAEETINDTMLVVWRKADEFAGRSKVSTWIFGIAYKKALKRLKASKRRAARELQVEVEAADPRDPADQVSDAALLERLRVAVARLPLAQRSIVQLSFFYGYSYGEIAEIVDCPVNTVKTRMFYARERLRPVLDKALDEEKRHARS
ncbi:MAG: RNA polymerase sigma factor [Gammaproteobacteria bacterium]|nr:RNA polymerase sigma factor [Gammaproteobacteria bacterium]